MSMRGQPGDRQRPRGNDQELSGWETAHLVTQGSADASEAELELTENELQRERRRRREALQRRRPVGFAPWPED